MAGGEVEDVLIYGKGCGQRRISIKEKTQEYLGRDTLSGLVCKADRGLKKGSNEREEAETQCRVGLSDCTSLRPQI